MEENRPRHPALPVRPGPVLLKAQLLAAALLATGCAGPERGRLADMRGRTALLAEEEESTPPPLETAPREGVKAFPLFFSEYTGRREVVEALWPIFERARSARSSFLRVRPFFRDDRAPDREQFCVFPFYFHSVERREDGERTAEHFWPFFGIERRKVDLAPATTRHVLWPIASFRTGGGRWRLWLRPALDLSSGFLDRGWWLFPVLKAGTGRGGWKGGSRFCYLLDPLFAYERFSNTLGKRPETPEDTRTELKLLGGLLGWERSDGRNRWRLFWFRI